MPTECIFCQIVAGRAPAQKIAETDDYIVIPDISAQAPVHLLCVDKAHGTEFATTDPDKLARMLTGVKKLVSDKGLSGLSYRIVMNGGEATLVKNHLHIHLLGSVSHDRPV